MDSQGQTLQHRVKTLDFPLMGPGGNRKVRRKKADFIVMGDFPDIGRPLSHANHIKVIAIANRIKAKNRNGIAGNNQFLIFRRAKQSVISFTNRWISSRGRSP